MNTNRALDLLGVPDLPINAFRRDASGKVKPQGGGGGAPSKSTVTQTNIPEWARPFAENMMGETWSLTDVNQNPYQPYTSQRFAGFSPMQVQAFQNIAGQQVAPQLTDASNLAYTGALQGLGVQPTAQALQSTALGYGQAGAGYGGAASTLGIAGAEQAAMDAARAQQQAQRFGGMGARYGAMGAQQAGQVAGQAGQAAQAYGGLGAAYGLQGLESAGRAQAQAERMADIYGQMGIGTGEQAARQAEIAQRQAERQADIYGQMGAGYGAAATGMAPAAQQYGSTAAGIGQAGMGYGAQGAGIGGLGVQAAQQGFGAQQAYQQAATSPDAYQAYMSPYMQNVVEQQQKDAIRQARIASQAEQAQAVGRGAFGGSRSAIVEAESAKNLQDRLAQIQAAGVQQAYQQAQQAQQFGAGLGIQGLQAGYQGLQTGLAGTAQGMQGAQVGIAGQQAGLAGLGQAGQLYGLGMTGAGLGLQGTGQRLAAGQLGLQGTAQQMQGVGMGMQGIGQRLAAGQLGLQGTAQGMQGAGLGLQGVGQQLAAGQLGLQGTAQGIQGAQAGLQGVGQQLAAGQLGLQGIQAGIGGQQAGIQGAQAGMQGVGQAVGAGQYGLAGAQLGIQGAGQLGQLGGQQFQQEMAITDALQKYGALAQQQRQQDLDFAYQQYLAMQQYPYQQQSFRSDMLRGVPSAQSAQFTYAPQPALAPQLLGTAMSAYGGFGRPSGAKEGGRVGIKSYAMGGDVTPDAMQTMNVMQLPSKLRRLSDPQLAAYARTVKDAITLSAINGELDRRTKARMPMGGYQDTTVADDIAKRAEAASISPRMYGGGIVALQGGGMPYDETPQDEIDFSAEGGDQAEGTTTVQDGSSPSQIGMSLDAARKNYDASKNIYYGFGSVQRKKDPAAFAEAEKNFNAAKEQVKTLQTEYEKALASSPISRPAYVQVPPEERAAPVTVPKYSSEATGAEGKPSPMPPEAPPRRAEAPSEKPAPTAGGPVGKGGLAGMLRGRQALEEQYKRMQARGEQDPEQKALLDDMRSRIEKKLGEAEKGKETAFYDALLSAGLAMMSGTSLADGIAKAAQTGGATYFASRKDAEKAYSAAQDAEVAFRKYQLELKQGDRDKAERSFNEYVKNAVDLAKVDAMYARGSGAGAVPAEDKAYNSAMIRMQGDKAISGWLKQLEDIATTPEQKVELTKKINERGRDIFKGLKIEDKFIPLPDYVAPVVPEKKGFWSGLFGGDSKPQASKSAPPAPPPGFVVQ